LGRNVFFTPSRKFLFGLGEVDSALLCPDLLGSWGIAVCGIVLGRVEGSERVWCSGLGTDLQRTYFWRLVPPLPPMELLRLASRGSAVDLVTGGG